MCRGEEVRRLGGVFLSYHPTPSLKSEAVSRNANVAALWMAIKFMKCLFQDRQSFILGSGGPGGPGDPCKTWGAKPPTFWKALRGPRGPPSEMVFGETPCFSGRRAHPPSKVGMAHGYNSMSCRPKLAHQVNACRFGDRLPAPPEALRAPRDSMWAAWR